MYILIYLLIMHRMAEAEASAVCCVTSIEYTNGCVTSIDLTNGLPLLCDQRQRLIMHKYQAQEQHCIVKSILLKLRKKTVFMRILK